MVIIAGKTFHFHIDVNWSMCGLIELSIYKSYAIDLDTKAV